MMDNKLKNIDRIDISINDLTIVFKTLIYEAVNEGRKSEKIDMQKKRNPYFQETESKLYKYPLLIKKIENDKLDIRDLEKELKKYGGSQRSKSIAFMTTGGEKIDQEEKQEIIIDSIKQKMKETQKEINKIEKALQSISNNKGYEIIKLKYFDRENDQNICDKLYISIKTLWIWKNRLITDLSVIFFGE
jgi:hypothetical protein